MTNEELVIRVKQEINTAEHMKQLYLQMKPFIGKLANKYRGYAETEDLEQEGYIALCEAVRHYDDGREVPFANYAAIWIKQGMQRYIQNNGNCVRIPSNKREKVWEYDKIVNAFRVYLNREPTRGEIAANMQISLKALSDIEKAKEMSQIGSTDAVLQEDGETTICDLIASGEEVESTVLDRMEHEQLKEVLWEMVDSLPGKQPEVIKKRYWDNLTLKETGQIIGVTPERVRVMERDALRRIRTSSRANNLYHFLPDNVIASAYRHVGNSEFNRTWTSATERAAFRHMEYQKSMKKFME